MIDLIFGVVFIMTLLWVIPYCIYFFSEIIGVCFDWILDKLYELEERKNNESNTNSRFK